MVKENKYKVSMPGRTAGAQFYFEVDSLEKVNTFLTKLDYPELPLVSQRWSAVKWLANSPIYQLRGENTVSSWITQREKDIREQNTKLYTNLVTEIATFKEFQKDESKVTEIIPE